MGHSSKQLLFFLARAWTLAQRKMIKGIHVCIHIQQQQFLTETLILLQVASIGTSTHHAHHTFVGFFRRKAWSLRPSLSRSSSHPKTSEWLDRLQIHRLIWERKTGATELAMFSSVGWKAVSGFYDRSIVIHFFLNYKPRNVTFGATGWFFTPFLTLMGPLKTMCLEYACRNLDIAIKIN